ncbi:hypothetical protein R1flu_026821 [Riccia fluitans]|uniref:Uncharacterized protein n=1 Tax=Riccia fluitans TaxID=41844 RepID=A0ABD1XL37_9MARC
MGSNEDECEQNKQPLVQSVTTQWTEAFKGGVNGFKSCCKRGIGATVAVRYCGDGNIPVVINACEALSGR